MKDCFIPPEVELNRTFAAIGLLRHVTDAIPLDAIAVYLRQTDQRWMLGNMTKLFSDWDVKDTPKIDSYNRSNREACIPNGIVKMTKDYMIRGFWQQVSHLRVKLGSTDGTVTANDDDIYVLRYPIQVLKTLAGLQLSQYGTLWDSRNAISAFHAACVPTTFDPPQWLNAKSRFYSIGDADESYLPGSTDTMKIVHQRNLGLLFSILNNYMWSTTNRERIPNEAEKNILLDLIEALTIFCGGKQAANAGFKFNYVRRQIYEYLRTSEFGTNTQTSANKFYRSLVRQIDPDNNSSYCVTGAIDAVINTYRHMSPEAAMILQAKANPRCKAPWNGYDINPDYLAKINPNPLREVAIYLKCECDIIKWKKMILKEKLRRIESGEAGCADGCEPGMCVEAPCESSNGPY